MNAFSWTLIVTALLVSNVLARMWLITRQVRHVTAHRDQVPVPFAGIIALAAHQKAADYTVAKARVGLIESALGAALLIGWTLLGGLHSLNQGLADLFGPGWMQPIALIVAYSLVGGLLDLPLSLYQTFVLEERFGFNKMTLKLWCYDGLKSLALSLLIGLPLVAAVLWFMQAAGPHWWIWAWAFWTGFSLLLMVIYPAFIAPWFNTFTPLQDPDLQSRVQALMQRCGFKARGFYVMDGSKRSAHANAYFTGFGATKRVVFYDTLLKRLSSDQVEAVLAHELGHFHHRHLIKRVVGMLVSSLLGFALLGFLAEQSWFYTGLNVQPNMVGTNSAVALILFTLVVPLATFWLMPVSAYFSRKHEYQADAYACANVDGDHLRAALLKLYEDNASTLTPDPVYVGFHYSHPPAVQRLAAMTSANPVGVAT